jgi:hypothetical protein
MFFHQRYKDLVFALTLRQKDNIKMGIIERGWGGTSSIHLDQDRDQWRAPVNMVGNLQVS